MSSARFQITANQEAGFTLLELLIATALLGLLSVVLVGSTRFGIQVWARSESAIADSNQIRRVQMALSEELSRAYPLFIASGTPDAHIDFDGGADRLTFLSPDRGLPGALARTRLFVETAENDTELVSTSALELSTGAASSKTVLFRGVKALSLSYFGSDKDGEPPSWQSDWHGKTRLPSLIRIRIALEGQQKKVWPDLVVAPRLTADVGCVFDPLSKTCRGR